MPPNLYLQSTPTHAMKWNQLVESQLLPRLGCSTTLIGQKFIDLTLRNMFVHFDPILYSLLQVFFWGYKRNGLEDFTSWRPMSSFRYQVVMDIFASILPIHGISFYILSFIRIYLQGHRLWRWLGLPYQTNRFYQFNRTWFLMLSYRVLLLLWWGSWIIVDIMDLWRIMIVLKLFLVV